MLAVSAILLLAVGFVACQTNHLTNTFDVKVTIGGDRPQEENFLVCNLTEPVAFFKKVKNANSTLKNIGPLCGNNTDPVQILIEGNKLTFTELKDPIGLEEYDYMCETMGGSNEIRFDIRVEPKCELFEGSSQMTVTAGAFKELRCVLKSGNYSNAEWIWLKNGNPINETISPRYKFSRVNHESILAIMDVENADQAVYTCLLKNDFGNSTQTFEFKVNGLFSSMLYYLIACGQVGAMTIAFLIYDRRSQKKKNEEDDENSRSMQRSTRA